MISQTDLEREVSQHTDSAIAAGHIVKADWLVNEVVNEHSEISGDDADWYRACAKLHIRSTVRDAVRRFRLDSKKELERNLVLPGFERLQVAYLVDRDHEQQVVPLVQLTDDEIDAKDAELGQMAIGCLLHQKELRRFKAERSKSPVIEIPAPSNN